MPRRASRGPREDEGEREDGGDLQDRGGPQASLHSRKEQTRRLHIRTSCQKLCDLLPFVDGPLDTATTLELTARYMGYLNGSLPPDLLSTVNETLKQNVMGSWKKSKNSSKKRRTICLRKTTTPRPKPSAKKTPDNAALWRNVPADQTSTQHLIAEGHSPPPPPPSPPPPPPTTGPVVMPILLDKWAVPRGQMLPLCQEQSISSTTSSFFSSSSSSSSSSFQCLGNNWITPTPRVFSNPAFPSPAFSSTSCPSPASNTTTLSTQLSQTAVLTQADATATAGGQAVANHVVTLQILDATDPVADAKAPASGGCATAVNLDAVWDPLDQTIVLSFSLPPPAATAVSPLAQPQPPQPEPWGAELDGDSSPPGPLAATVPERWPSSFDALNQQSGVGGRPITTGIKEKTGPYWLDLLLDDSLCIPEAIFETNAAVGNTASDQSHGPP